MIRDGAQLVSGPEEILEDLSCLPGLLTAAGVAGSRERERKNGALARIEAEFGGTQAAVWRTIGEQGRAHVDGIARALSLPVPEISRAVMEMELGGHLVRRLDGCYERS